MMLNFNYLKQEMGIQDLFKFVKTVNVSVNDILLNYKIGRVGIDMSCLLHKCKYAKFGELAIDINSSAFVLSLLRYLKPFIENDIGIVCVFDGATPPEKAREHELRRKDFNFKKIEAQILMESNEESDIVKGRMMFVQTIEVSVLVEKIKKEIDSLRIDKKIDIDYIDARFEADTGLVYLARNGDIDLIVSEDSDMMAYRCPLVLYKYKPRFNNDLACGMMFEYETTSISYKKGKDNKVTHSILLKNFDKLENFCVMSGCDYFKGFKGIGPKSAFLLCISVELYNKFYETITDKAKFEDRISIFKRQLQVGECFEEGENLNRILK